MPWLYILPKRQLIPCTVRRFRASILLQLTIVKGTSHSNHQNLYFVDLPPNDRLLKFRWVAAIAIITRAARATMFLSRFMIAYPSIDLRNATQLLENGLFTTIPEAYTDNQSNGKPNDKRNLEP